MKFGVNNEIVDQLRAAQPHTVILKAGPWSDSEFLKDIAGSLKRLYVGCETFDWQVLPELTSLRELEIGGWFKCDVPFDRLEALEYLWTYWNDGYDDRVFRIPHLKALRIHGFKGRDLSGIGKLGDLVYLGLYYSRKIEALDGIGDLSDLRRLDLVQCPALEDIRALAGCDSLESLRVEGCKRLRSYEGILGLELRELNLFGCGPFPELASLSHLAVLRWLVFDCDVDDGSLEFLYELEDLDVCVFKNKRNYSIKAKAIEAYLKERGRFQLPRFSDWYAFQLGQPFPEKL